jgi:hypothetical protein
MRHEVGASKSKKGVNKKMVTEMRKVIKDQFA